MFQIYTNVEYIVEGNCFDVWHKNNACDNGYFKHAKGRGICNILHKWEESLKLYSRPLTISKDKKGLCLNVQIYHHSRT